MKKEIRTIVYDEELRIEAYSFKGILQPFPNHFHEYYVIGFMEEGTRFLSCRNREYTIKKGDLLLFNPCDSHGCVQRDDGALYYLGLNISKDVMRTLSEEVTGKPELPGFSQNVVTDGEAACCLLTLHDLVMKGSREFEKEESLYLLLSLLLKRYGQPFERSVPECREEIEEACRFMEQHYPESISLDQICRSAGLSKSTLLRAFTKSKGVTPYRYLENVRIGEAKKRLEQGVSPVDAALQTGFSDQSHFSNYFSRFIGLSPGAYRDIFLEKRREEGIHHEK